jgi:hypothetical protein
MVVLWVKCGQNIAGAGSGRIRWMALSWMALDAKTLFIGRPAPKANAVGRERLLQGLFQLFPSLAFWLA